MKKIKEKILLAILFIFKWHLRIIYFFIKLFTKRRKRVFFLSRQFSDMPLNYEMLVNKLNEDNVEVKVICKKVSVGVNSIIRNEKKKNTKITEIFYSIGYYFNLYKQMFYIATSKVVIIDGYNLTTSVLKHKKDTTIIQLWHALAAIKKFGYQTIGYPDGLKPRIAKMLCMHKNYNYVISGSKAMNKYIWPQDEYAEWLNILKQTTLCLKWYSAHMHSDNALDLRTRIIYNDIIEFLPAGSEVVHKNYNERGDTLY